MRKCEIYHQRRKTTTSQNAADVILGEKNSERAWTNLLSKRNYM